MAKSEATVDRLKNTHAWNGRGRVGDGFISLFTIWVPLYQGLRHGTGQAVVDKILILKVAKRAWP